MPPALSVVVPVYNSRRELVRCLTALRASEEADFEVLVVDDGSDLPVGPLVSEFGFASLRIPGPEGPARARNVGAAIARARYLVFVDADVCLHRDALRRMAEALDAEPQLAAVIGSYDDEPAEPDFFSQYKNLFHHYVHQCNSGRVTSFWTGCGVIRRDVFNAIGGFDEQRYRRPSIEDIELGTWLTAAGHRIHLDGTITGKHLKRWSFRTMLRTDLLERGVPWVRLMWRAGATARTLNVTPAQRGSVALAYLALLFGLISVWFPHALAGVFASIGATATLNAGLYSFFRRRKGVWFAARAIVMHWLYLLYCGLAVILGTVLYFAIDRRRRVVSGPSGAGLAPSGS